MLSLFSKNYFIHHIALILYAAVVRSFSFFDQATIVTEHDGPLMTALSSVLPTSSIGADLAAIILVFIQATLINRYVIIHRLAVQITLFPGLFYILFTALLPSYQVLSAELVANTFIILAFGELYRIYKKKLYAIYLFNAGFLISIASLFQPGYILFIIWAVMSTAIMNSVNTKRIFQLLIGAATPMAWAAFFYYINDDFVSFRPDLTAALDFMDIGVLNQGTHWLSVIVILVIVLWTALSYNSTMSKRLIKSRKGIDILYWMLLFGAIITLFQYQADEYNLLPVLLPTSILASFWFSDTKYPTMAELGHFVLFVLLLSMNAIKFFAQN